MVFDVWGFLGGQASYLCVRVFWCMCSVGLVRIAGFEKNGFPEGHPMRRERVALALKVIEMGGAVNSLRTIDFDRDDGKDYAELLKLFHEDAYISFVKRMSEIGEGLLDYGDTPCFPKCYETFSHVAKASAEMCEMFGALDHVVNLYGGLHHAYPSRASGFCVFNDVGVAIRRLRSLGFRRIAYIDIDGHHGDGVMYSFYSDPDLLIVDFHEDGRYLFPGTGFVHELGEGEGYGKKVNVVLPPYASDPDYLYAFDTVVPGLIRGFRPEVVLLQAGVDSHMGDPLTHLELTDEGYLGLVSRVHQLAHEVCAGRLAVFGGGGYNLGSVARCWAGLVYGLAGIGPKAPIAALAEAVFEESGFPYEEVGVEAAKREVLEETKRSLGELMRLLRDAGWDLATQGSGHK